MNIENLLSASIVKAVKENFKADINAENIQLQETRKEFKGDITLVVFPFLRYSRKSPELTAEIIGKYLQSNIPEVDAYNVVKGFLNLEISTSYWLKLLNEISETKEYGYSQEKTGHTIMIEYSSPNTNKPLHLGHIRNNLVGWSVSQIQKAVGHNVIMVNLVNDRGIHICKSMVAWLKFANGVTPADKNVKGDHFVGEYYVKFDKKYKAEIKELVAKGMSEDEAAKKSPILLEAQEMLRKWEAGDEAVVALWRKMNDWVLKGFDETYKMMGIHFDKIYFESETYKKGRSLVLKGLKDGVLYKKDTGSIWADLSKDGLDQKLLLRDDGTSVYMTQDIGTAYDRFNEFDVDEEVYVVGNEQNYHFQVLKLVCKKLGFDWADKIKHLSYGMVELPEGKMKSREGTVVDADDLMEEMVNTAREMSKELGRLDGLSEEEAEETYRRIGLGALKYFILKVDPKKTMMFNPKESIDFNGNTSSFIQYSYARIKSVLRKSEDDDVKLTLSNEGLDISEKEQNLVKLLARFPSVVKEAGDNYSPAVIGNYAYELAKEFNQFYHDFSILKEEDKDIKNFRILLSKECSIAIANAMKMLGVDMPERM